MKAVILAAGMGKRLFPLTKDTPKCLVDIAGKSILSRQLDALAQNGINEIVVVIGHFGYKIKEFLSQYSDEFKITFIENKDYMITDSTYSLWLARDELKQGYIHLNSDLIFHPDLLKKLLEKKQQNSIIIDKNVEAGSDMVKVVMDENGQITEMSRDENKEYIGEAIGPVLFSEEGAKRLLEIIDQSVKRGNTKKQFYFLLDTFAKESNLFGIDSEKKSWFEIDDFQDLEKVEHLLNNQESFEASELKNLGFEDSFIVSSQVGVWERQCQKKIIKTHIGVPSFSMPDNVKNAIIDAISQNKVNYTPTKGIFELRKSIIENEFTNRRNVSGLNPDDNIIITVGAKGGLFATLLLWVKEGKKVLYPEPGHPAFISMINYKKGKPVPYFPFSLEGESRKQFTDNFKEKITKEKPSVLIFNSPHNPSGYIILDDEMKEICEIINEYNRGKDISEKIKVVSDEVYDSLVFNKHFASPVSYLTKDTPWAVIWSASKIYSLGGSRIGYIVSNRPSLINSCEKIANNVWSCPPAEGQIGLLEALNANKKEEIEVYKRKMIEYYQNNVNLLIEGIKGIIDRKTGIISFVKPEGTFYLFIKIDDKVFENKKTKNSYELYKYLLYNYYISTLHGTSFGELGEKFLRISASLPKEDIPEALKRLEEGLKSLLK